MVMKFHECSATLEYASSPLAARVCKEVGIEGGEAYVSPHFTSAYKTNLVSVSLSPQNGLGR